MTKPAPIKIVTTVLLSAVSLPAIAAGSTSTKTERVLLDRTTIIELPRGADAVVVGDPTVLRVTKLPDGAHAALTGLSYGVTNVIVLDSHGAVETDIGITVGSSGDNGVVVQRGSSRATYHCTVVCAPRLELGDSPENFARVLSDTVVHNGQATSRALQSTGRIVTSSPSPLPDRSAESPVPPKASGSL